MDEDIVNRYAETKENAEVDRIGITAEPDEVDRNRSTLEDESSGITFYIHPVPHEKSLLLKGLHPPQSLCYSVGQHVIFGRGTDVNVFLNDDKASRSHMELTAMRLPTSGQQLLFKIKKISQKLSLHINNQIVNPGEERFLRTSDIIKIGQLTFTVKINGNHVYSNSNVMYHLVFQMLPSVQYTSGIPARLDQTGISYNPTAVQTFGMPALQALVPAPQRQLPVAAYTTLVPQTHMSSYPVPQQGSSYPVPQQGSSYPVPQQGSSYPVPQQGSSYPVPQQGSSYPVPQQGSSYPVPQQGPFPENATTDIIPGNNNPGWCTPSAMNPRDQQQVTSQERREMFQQNSAGHKPSENDDNGHPRSLSVQETQPPKLSSETCLEETQPPKLT